MNNIEQIETNIKEIEKNLKDIDFYQFIIGTEIDFFRKIRDILVPVNIVIIIILGISALINGSFSILWSIISIILTCTSAVFIDSIITKEKKLKNLNIEKSFEMAKLEEQNNRLNVLEQSMNEYSKNMNLNNVKENFKHTLKIIIDYDKHRKTYLNYLKKGILNKELSLLGYSSCDIELIKELIKNDLELESLYNENYKENELVKQLKRK